MSHKIIIICGPTASGKSKVGIEIASKFNGEIVSADSGAVWRGFDIGTAKIRSRPETGDRRPERTTVPHHLIDVVSADESFDAAKFVELADKAIADIMSRKKLPVVVGGTGMWLKMLVHGACDAPPKDVEIRKRLEGELKEHGIELLHERLKTIDPESAQKIKPADKTRIIRALEIFEITGVKTSSFREGHKFKERRYNALKIGLKLDREELYKRVEKRVDEMIENGFVGEVRGLLSRYNETCQPFFAVGYKEIVKYLKGEMDLSETVELIKQNTRRFAKRQMTWFRADKEIKWFSPDDVSGIMDEISKSLIS